MAEPLPTTTLAWLRQCAKVEGVVAAQVMLNLLERVEALEQRPTCKECLQVAPTPPSRAALERLLGAVDVYEATGMDVLDDAIAAARTALAAEPVGECPGCEGTPAASNSPCAVCSHPATPPAPEPGDVGELWALAAALRDPCIAPLLSERTRAATLLQQQAAPAPVAVPVAVKDALIKAECALSDVAEGEPECDEGDPAQWAKQRCAETLANIRPVMKRHKIRTSEWPPQPLPQAGEGEV